MRRLGLRTLARYATVTAILVGLGSAFAWQQWHREPAATMGLRDSRALEVGQPAPDFELHTFDGQTVRLSSLRGKTVLINFWASWCGPCRFEMPEFERLWQERGPRGDLAIVAVNAAAQDTPGEARAFAREQGLTFSVAFDTADGAVVARYGVRGLPSSFFVDRDGILRDRVIGPALGAALTEKLAMADAGGR